MFTDRSALTTRAYSEQGPLAARLAIYDHQSDRVDLHPGAYVGPGAVIGDDTILGPNAVVHQGCKVGARCYLYAGAAQDTQDLADHLAGHVGARVPSAAEPLPA